MNAFLQRQYELLRERQGLISDRVRGVAYRNINGFYLWGPPGTSKTHTVRSTLDAMQIQYDSKSGHLTEGGLFELLQANRNRIIVLDDLPALFNKPKALQLLVAALGDPHDGSRTRHVSYVTAFEEVTIPFEGGIIAVGNTPLEGRHKEILAALRDRFECLKFNPSDDQIKAAIMKIAEGGLPDITPEEAITVAEELVAECSRREARPSLRRFMSKAIPDFRLWKAGRTQTHWRDLMASSLAEELVELQHETKDVSRSEKLEAERRIVIQLEGAFENREQRLDKWEAQTGKARSSYDRRLQEVRDAGRLPRQRKRHASDAAANAQATRPASSDRTVHREGTASDVAVAS